MLQMLTNWLLVYSVIIIGRLYGNPYLKQDYTGPLVTDLSNIITLSIKNLMR